MGMGAYCYVGENPKQQSTIKSPLSKPVSKPIRELHLLFKPIKIGWDREHIKMSLEIQLCRAFMTWATTCVSQGLTLLIASLVKIIFSCEEAALEVPMCSVCLFLVKSKFSLYEGCLRFQTV